MKRRLICLCALLLSAAMVTLCLHAPFSADQALRPVQQRQLMRIWAVSSVGGGEAWLKKQLQQFEKQHPGVMTYLRMVSPEEVGQADAVLPDLILYTPGVLVSPQEFFAPLDEAESLHDVIVGMHPALLQCGQYDGVQYGLPLCWGAYVLCVDSSLDEAPAATPSSTSLWGYASATEELAATQAPYPYDRVLQADMPLLAPSGCGTLALCGLLDQDQRPALQEGTMTTAQVYAAFRSRQCASAVLTTGQVTAMETLTSAGKGFAFRTMVPDAIVTDQVWLGSIVQGAENSAASQLLRYLAGAESQRVLTAQGLHTALGNLKLYASGVAAQVESAARRSLTALNAYHAPDEAFSVAYQVYTGQLGLGEALLLLT